MIFVEPPRAFEQRRLVTHSPTPAAPTPSRPQPFGQEWWIEQVFDVIRENGEEAMRFTSVVNAVVRRGNYTYRADREAKKAELFRLVCKLIRIGLLDRVGRKHVNLPRSDARRRAYLASSNAPLDLPPPNL